MLRMVSHPHRPHSGHITCYLNRTYHVLPTLQGLPNCLHGNSRAILPAIGPSGGTHVPQPAASCSPLQPPNAPNGNAAELSLISGLRRRSCPLGIRSEREADFVRDRGRLSAVVGGP